MIFNPVPALLGNCLEPAEDWLVISVLNCASNTFVKMCGIRFLWNSKTDLADYGPQSDATVELLPNKT